MTEIKAKPNECGTCHYACECREAQFRSDLKDKVDVIFNLETALDLVFNSINVNLMSDLHESIFLGQADLRDMKAAYKIYKHHKLGDDH